MRGLTHIKPVAISMFVGTLFILTPHFVGAHDIGITSIARVFIDQVGQGRYALSSVDIGLPPIRNTPGILPDGCERLSEEGISQTMLGFRFQCDNELMFDDIITLPWDLAGVVAIARWSDGTGASAYFRGKGLSLIHI